MIIIATVFFAMFSPTADVAVFFRIGVGYPSLLDLTVTPGGPVVPCENTQHSWHNDIAAVRNRTKEQ